MKIFHSVRAKLTLWYSLTVGATLIGSGTIAYYYTQEKLFSSLDYSLRNEVVWLKTFIEPRARRVRLKRQIPKPAVPADTTKEKKKVRRTNEVNMVATDSIEYDQIWNQIYEHTLLSPKKQIIQIRDRNGDILYKSYSLGKEDIIFEDIPFDITKLVTIYDSKGQALRLAVTQNPFTKIYVAYPEAEVTEVLANLFSIFTILAPASLIISILGGWFLASRSLRPVDQVTRTARAITAQNLDKRIIDPGVDDEIGRLVLTLNDMIERLQNSFEQIKQFSIDASHELRTPLTIMRGEIELALRSKQSSEEYRRTLSSSLDETLRMSSIIESLSVLAKGDMGKLTFHFSSVDLESIIRELLEDSIHIAKKKKIDVKLGVIEPAVVHGDSIRLRQLFLNLIDNAIKYTPDGGSVSLSLANDSVSAHIIVEDTGIGISPDEQTKIFDRFYRVDKGRSREMGGTGLGLSIAKWIAQMHNGTIKVSSQINIGSRFIVTIPLITKEQKDISA